MATIITFIYFFLLSTNCIQEFSLLGVTRDNTDIPTFWIINSTNRECESSILFQIMVSDSSVVVIETNFKEYKKTELLIKALTELDQFSVVQLNKGKDSLFYSTGMNFSLKETYSDTSKFTDYLLEKVAKYYRVIPHNPDNYVIPPQFSGVKAQLKYYYKSGLYINYKIDRVIFVPYKKLLIVFTKQSITASGGDSMHGFMIFQLAN